MIRITYFAVTKISSLERDKGARDNSYMEIKGKKTGNRGIAKEAGE